MKASLLISVVVLALTQSSFAQLSGTFKISKESPEAMIERIEFKADGTADVVQCLYNVATRRYGPASKEVRVECQHGDAAKFDQFIEKAKADKGMQDGDLLKKMINFRSKGYDRLVIFQLGAPVNGLAGRDYEIVILVGKGDELVDVSKGFVFKKAGWF